MSAWCISATFLGKRAELIRNSNAAAFQIPQLSKRNVLERFQVQGLWKSTISRTSACTGHSRWNARSGCYQISPA